MKAARTKLHSAPVPACSTTLGTMMKIDEAGVIEDRVISRAPIMCMLRLKVGTDGRVADRTLKPPAPSPPARRRTRRSP